MDVRFFAFLAGRPSAAIQPREQFCGLPKRALALLLANVMFWQPLWAQAEGIAVSAPGTSLGQAGNGVPIVNIAAPNGSGLSHNQFSDYNVGREGLILNNATGRTQSTQLGGIILGNSNLQGAAASTILNEVNGSNPSHLRGFTEVAGQSARVIVANPHGITCDGCGFINTPRVTLSTGKPILDGNGQVRSYQVDGGAIAIEGSGLDARNVDRFELITRSAKVNAKLHAKQLDIVTGRNDVDANTLKAIARASDGSVAPSLAIDSTALGGMYAGAIRLVGTEQGVGVRLAGDMAVDAGDLDIDASGKLTLANASAGQDVKLKADEVELTGSTYAGRNASVHSSGDVEVRQSLAARQHVTVGGAQVRNQGVIEAGVEADKRRNDSADLTLTSTGLVNSGQIVASRDLTVKVSDTLVNSGGLKGQRQTVVADTLDNRGGKVLADSELKVTSRVLDNRAAGALSSDGNTTVTARERLDNQGGRVVGVTELQVNGGEVNNGAKGLIASDGQLTVDVAQLNNQGGKLSASHQQLKGGGLNNQGGSVVGNTVEATFDRLDNQGGSLVAREGAATVTARQQLNNGGGTLQAKTHLQVNGGELLNQGGALLGASVTLDGASLDNSQKGRVVAEEGDLTVKASGAVNNSGGRLQATVANVDISAASLDNQSGVVVGQKAVKATATGGTLDNRAGQLLGSRLELTADTVDNRVGGQVLAGSEGLLIKANTVRNQQGKLLAGGSLAELLLGAGRLDNQQGSLTASAITLVAGDADNSGGTLASLAGNQQLTVQRLINRSGLIEASQSVQVKGQSLDNSGGKLIAHAGDKASIELSGQLDNRGGRIASATTDLEVKAANLLNQGATLEHAGLGSLVLNANAFSGSQGSVSSLGKGSWTLANVASVGTWHTNGALDVSGLQSIALGAGERIASASDLRLAGVQLSNAGELVTDGKLTLEMSGDLVNQGLFSSLKAMSISGNNLTQDGGRIASKEAMTLTLNGTLSNRGRLTSSQTLAITAASIDNQGTLGAQGKATLHARGAINNQQDSLLFAGGPLELRGTSLLNRYADIYSKGDLSFAALGGGRAASLQNLSGSIESEGSIDLKVDSLENAKADFVAGTAIVNRYFRINCTDCSGGHNTGQFILTTTYKGTVTRDSPAARLLANRDMTLDTVTVDNRHSLLAANGNLTATAQNFYNRGLTLDGRVEETSYLVHDVSSGTFAAVRAIADSWNAQNRDLPGDQQAPLPTEITSYPIWSDGSTVRPGAETAYAGTVQAGGTLSLNVSGELVNGTLDAQTNAQLTGKALDSSAGGAGGVQVTLGTQAGDPGPLKDVKRIETTLEDGTKQISFVPVDFSGAPFVSVDPTALPSFRLPQGEYGLFVRSQNPSARYLIETNPELTDPGRFMASDYLLGNLGFDPDQAWRRLGDGRYETRLVADAVRAQTGQRFLADGLSSDYEQFKYLMDNAVASKDALGLSVGVGLTSQQVAALTHDIVWMEERVVDGEKVLAPVLYLAKVDSRNLRGGSLIQGRDLDLVTGGDLKSVGTLRASNDLIATVGGSFYQGGLTQANESLAITAQDSIRNALAGEIRGNDVELVSLKGDILNDRTATEVGVGNDRITRVDAGSLISARGDLKMVAAEDLTNKGRISSGGDLTAKAGGDINLVAVQDRTVTVEGLDRGLRTEETVKLLGSSVEAGGNLTFQAGGDFNMVASSASAGKDLGINATGDVNLISGEDLHSVDTHRKDGKKKIHEVEEQTHVVSASLSAGNNLDVKAGNDVNLVASKLTAGDEAYIFAGNDINLIAAQERDYSLYDMTKKGGWGSKQTQRDEVTDITHVGTQITTGGDLTLISDGDQLYQAAKLNSGNDLTLISGGSITFESVKDLHDESHTKSKGDLAWNSSKGKGSTDETLIQSELNANGSLIMQAVDGIKIDIKQVDQQSVSQIIDSMVEANPNLAWLKEAEKRGDIDWRQVKEIHESFKYSQSGLGAAPSLIIAIVAAAYLGPLMGAFASNLAVGSINNGGNIGQGLKFALSKENLQSYAIAAASAYLISPQLDKAFGVSTDNANKITKGFDLGSMTDIVRFGAYATTQSVLQAGLETAIKGGSYAENLKGNLVVQAGNVGMAIGFNMIGDWSLGKYPEGSPQKVMAHALFGGLVAKASGSDFMTGALAAGANEALSKALQKMVGGDENLELMASQIVGVLAGVAVDGDFAKGSEIAKYATAYNQQVHRQAKERLEKGLAVLHAKGQYLDLDADTVLVDLRKIADGKVGSSKELNPQVVAFLNAEFDVGSLREQMFEPEEWEEYAGIAIELLYPMPAGKINALQKIGGKLSPKALAMLEEKFGVDVINAAYKGADDVATVGGKTCVYSCVIDGTTRYVGITKDIVTRGKAHMAEKGIVIDKIDGLENLSREDARAVEQALIVWHGFIKYNNRELQGGTLLNKINSISKVKDPTAYEKAVIRGIQLLRSVKYEGF
ncbi:two-partner secretion domain-containing protein [Pseudomonas sichuanensis]